MIIFKKISPENTPIAIKLALEKAIEMKTAKSSRTQA